MAAWSPEADTQSIRGVYGAFNEKTCIHWFAGS